jgi:alkanesulfonate monooxygenase SsuD/methylene tetrahydromethanopterin reductase-like flavin-dependent oxidoreductase (luciferase family)
MLAMDPYPGYRGRYFDMPCRNIVPKPVQRPHPPLWVACSQRETIRMAARMGIGALTFAFVDPAEAKAWVDEYYAIIKSEACVPIGHAINANICMVSSFSCHQDRETAARRGLEGFEFFGYALGSLYGFGEHRPGRTDLWKEFQGLRKAHIEQQMQDLTGALTGGRGGIGTPQDLRAHLAKFEVCGVDQVTFIQQAGMNHHDHICEALTLFADEVMPEFKARHTEREAAKQRELAPYLEAAMARRVPMPTLTDDAIPLVPALGRQISEEASSEPSRYARPAAG